MTPLRVVHVVWRLSATGGIPRVVRDLATTLDSERIELHVATVRPRLEEDRLDEVIPRDRFHTAGHRVGASRASLVPAIVRLTSELRRLRPDVIHLHSGTSWIGLPAAISLRPTALVLEVHDEPQSGRSRRANVAIMRASARRLRFRLLAHSTVVRERTAAAFGVPVSSIALIPLGIDIDSFRVDPRLRARGREFLGVDADRPIVVWVGRLEPLKRPTDALTVASAVHAMRPDALFVLVGSGSLDSALRGGASGTNYIRLVGQVADLPAVLNAADVYLSTSAYEGFGLSVAEAMACGLPVVSTRAGGVVDVVEEGVTGHLVEVGDLDGLAAEIASVLGDHVRRTAVGRAARNRVVERFSRAAMARSYESLYDTLRT
jgi:glycosyltransferase involved in cell wall biosynthesis